MINIFQLGTPNGFGTAGRNGREVVKWVVANFTIIFVTLFHILTQFLLLHAEVQSFAIKMRLKGALYHKN